MHGSLVLRIISMGLFGLSAYTISRRVKEISICKILGASIPDLFGMLSREYLVLIAVAQVVAWPLAWWFATEWLSGFAYQVEVPLTVFIVTLLAGLALGLLSISVHIFKAVRSSPAETLRIEA